MKTYYYKEGNQQNGPVSIEELKAARIDSGTLVWTEGMEEWMPAGQVEELSFLPPPPPTQGRTVRMTKHVTLSIIGILIALLLVLSVQTRYDIIAINDTIAQIQQRAEEEGIDLGGEDDQTGNTEETTPEETSNIAPGSKQDIENRLTFEVTDNGDSTFSDEYGTLYKYENNKWFIKFPNENWEQFDY